MFKARLSFHYFTFIPQEGTHHLLNSEKKLLALKKKKSLKAENDEHLQHHTSRGQFLPVAKCSLMGEHWASLNSIYKQI